MVGRLLRVFNREWSGLHEAAFLLAGTAILSQVLGLFRDRLLAEHFGAGGELDIYYAAFRVPDFLYASLASFVAVTVLIPFLLEKVSGDDDPKHVVHFMRSVFTVFVVVMAFGCFLAYIAMPRLSMFIVPGFSPDAQKEFIWLSRILLLSPFLLGVSNLFGAVTQSLRRFFVFAAGPILYNIGIIVGILFLMPRFGLTGVVFGVILGAFFHVVIQLPVLFASKLVPQFTWMVSWKDIRRVALLSLPRTLALSAANFSMIILVAIASQITLGSIAVFTLAMNLQSIPLAIIGMSYSVAAFPTLAQLWGKGNRGEFLGEIMVAMRHIMFWSFPAIALFVVLRAQIVRAILGSGQFDWTATRLTAAALALFALSIVAQNLVLLLTRAFYAMGRTKLPLIANLAGAALVVISSLALLFSFDHYSLFHYFSESLLRVSDISGTAILMLPLGYSIGMIANVLLLLYFLKKAFPLALSGVKKAFLHSFTASVVLGFAAYHGLRFFALVFDLETFWGIFLQGLLAGLLGIFAAIFLLRLMGNKELEEVRISLHKKFWNVRPIATEREVL
ncbi:MAG: lipid II flippase MurJ [bacterium]|nr:lipid II flippase MurJ [bacterium]